MVLSYYSKKNAQVVGIVNQIKKSLINALPTNYLDLNEHRQYVETRVFKNEANVYRRVKVLAASASCPIVYVCAFPFLLNNFNEIRRHLPLFSPKIDLSPLIFIHVTKSLAINYKKVFLQWVSSSSLCQIVDADILQVGINPKQLHSFSLKLHQYDAYEDRYSINSHTHRFKWFPYKYKNLHKRDIFVGVFSHSSKDPHFQLTRSKNGQLVPHGYYGLRLLAMEKSINFTIRYKWFHLPHGARGKNVELWKLQCDFYSTPIQIRTNHLYWGRTEHTDAYMRMYPPMKINDIERYIVVLPIRFRQYFEFDTSLLISLMLFVASIILIVWCALRISLYNKETWNYLLIMGMMIGVSFDRRLSRGFEKALYLGFFATGYFCCGDIFSNLMRIIYPEKMEVRVTNFKELNATGFPVFLDSDTRNNMLLISGYNNDMEIILGRKLKVFRRQQTSLAVLHMLRFMNVSLVMDYREAALAIEFSKFKSTEPSFIRETPINVFVTPVTQMIRSWSCYYHRFSDFVWRYDEGGHTNRNTRVDVRPMINKFMRLKFLKYKINIDDADSDNDSEELILGLKLLLLMCFGFFSAIIALVFEIYGK